MALATDQGQGSASCHMGGCDMSGLRGVSAGRRPTLLPVGIDNDDDNDDDASLTSLLTADAVAAAAVGATDGETRSEEKGRRGGLGERQGPSS